MRGCSNGRRRSLVRYVVCCWLSTPQSTPPPLQHEDELYADANNCVNPLQLRYHREILQQRLEIAFPIRLISVTWASCDCHVINLSHVLQERGLSTQWTTFFICRKWSLPTQIKSKSLYLSSLLLSLFSASFPPTRRLQGTAHSLVNTPTP